MKTDGIEALARELELDRQPRFADQGENSDAALDPPLTIYTAKDFLGLTIPPRVHVLKPILREKDTAMLYGPRGIGKTFTALGIAYAIASAGKFLKWTAPKARQVLYIDGEMPAEAMQMRLAGLVKSSGGQAPSCLKFLLADLEERGIPDLSQRTNQARMSKLIEGVEVLVLDSVSTLCRSGKENEAESWLPIQEWILSLRRRGITVLIVHHAGKSGQQRGTSRREDVLDTVIALRKPADYQPQEGARAEIHFEKNRGFFGDDAQPFEVRLQNLETGLWKIEEIEDVRLARLVAMVKDGCPANDVAEALGVARATFYRELRKAKDKGLLEDSK